VHPWLHVWTVSPEQPTGSTAVAQPYNYPFADNVPDALQSLLPALLKAPGVTPLFGYTEARVTADGLKDDKSRDIWGPSKNTLLYIQDTTLRVTANGYAIHLKRSDVQQAVFDFTTEFTRLLKHYEQQEQYPVNGAVEIRVTSLDDPAEVAMGSGIKAESPVISALIYDDLAKNEKWEVALWIDVLTIPGTNYSNDFYHDLEVWVLQTFPGTKNSLGRAMPEWSKGWAYGQGGPLDQYNVPQLYPRNVY